MICLLNRLTAELHAPRSAALGILLLASACTSVGPGTQRVVNAGKNTTIQGIQVINLDENSWQASVMPPTPGFAQTLGQSEPVGEIVGPGDVLEVTIWEAPPAVLFSTAPIATSVDTSRSTSMPQYLVGPSGQISVPFAGMIQVTGRTLSEIERDIAVRLRGKAHLPQTAVRLIRNMSANVSVVGEVDRSVRMPLTAKGETILDAIAAAGGTKAPSDKVTIQVSRGGQAYSMPLSAVIRDPRQNVVLRTGDVVTALFQPYSFTVIGAAGKNDEINFEATGLTLAQAVGRFGGLQDNRADPKGLFLFRWENPAAVPAASGPVTKDAQGRVPVIYRVNMKDPGTYLAMQRFTVHDKDVIYVANSTIAEFQRFVGIMASTVFPIVAIDNAVSSN